MVFSAHLTVLRLITTVWAITSEISYLREFSAQKRQIVLSAHLTVLRLITTVWVKTSKISYLREFSAQVSQIVFSAQLTVLRPLTTVWQVTQMVFSAQNVLQVFKNLISPEFSAQVHKSCYQLIWPFYGLLQLYEKKLQKSHISVSSVHKYHESCLSSFDRFTVAFTTVWAKTSKISYLREFSAQSITNRVLSSFDRFTAYYN